MVVELPPEPPPSSAAPSRPAARASAFSSRGGAAVPGYPLVLSGELLRDLEIGPERSPVLVSGVLIVPQGRTLFLKGGAELHLRPAVPPSTRLVAPSTSAPERGGMLWVYGRLLADGLSGQRVLIAGQVSRPGGESRASFNLYGRERSELRGVRFSRLSINQHGGQSTWLGCTFQEVHHFALAAGAALFLQDTFRQCGGLLATYDAGPWSLLLKRCLFENCREGLVMGRDPGTDCLIVERNAFLGTRGANLRAVAVRAPGKRNGRPRRQEVLIGENWYGTPLPERIDARIVDRRRDPALGTRINTRPPAERPYAMVGAAVPVRVIARALSGIEPRRAQLLAVHTRRLAAWRRKSAARKK